MSLAGSTKSPSELDRANRMFAVDNAVKLGDLSKKDEILVFLNAGVAPEEASAGVIGFHSPA